jgi:hypothetical protein
MELLSGREALALKVGDRVAFPKGADAYPDFCIIERIEGTVSAIEKHSVWVRCDRHFPELNEWDNQIEAWIYENDTDYGTSHPMVRI